MQLLRTPLRALMAACVAMAALVALDRLSPALGWYAFVLLTLTLGMGHGALDTALLLYQFKPTSKAALYGLAYLLLAIGAAWLLSLSMAWALLALLLMSVWHFGELYRHSLAMRCVVGGSSVMAPVLLSGTALSTLIAPALGASHALVWQVWQALAVAWAVGAAAWGLWAIICHTQHRDTPALQDSAVRAALEVAVVLALNAALSPLMAFAVYFGLWHSLAHMARVRRALAQHASRSPLGRQRLAWVIALTGLATALLMLLLWRAMPAALPQQINSTVVQWLIVALGALTLPHMLLVGYSHRWLGP